MPFASPLGQIAVAASADINPCRFISYTAVNTATQTAAGGRPIGISAEFTEREPNDLIATTPWGVHATTGKPVSYYIPGQICNLELGGTVLAAGIIMPSTAGVGIAATGASYFESAMAISGGGSGERIPVLVLQPVFRA